MYPHAFLFPRTKRLPGGILRTLLLVLALTLASAGAANADSFLPGTVSTSTQSQWADVTTSAGAALDADFASVYAPQGGGLLVGLVPPRLVSL